MSEWKTIDTAPTDGSPILLFDPMQDFLVGEGYFACEDGSDGLWRLSQDFDLDINPTHWMPLLEDPSH